MAVKFLADQFQAVESHKLGPIFKKYFCVEDYADKVSITLFVIRGFSRQVLAGPLPF